MSIQYLGDPHSAQAHSTIPRLLTVPQVYLLAAVLISAILGLPVQWVRNWASGKGNRLGQAPEGQWAAGFRVEVSR